MTTSQQPQFRVIEDEGEPQDSANNAAAAAIALALKALSQRAIVAAGALFTLLTCASVFWVWLSVPNPSVLQLVSLGMYALFILSANWLVRRA